MDNNSVSYTQYWIVGPMSSIYRLLSTDKRNKMSILNYKTPAKDVSGEVFLNVIMDIPTESYSYKQIQSFYKDLQAVIVPRLCDCSCPPKKTSPRSCKRSTKASHE